MSSAEVMSFAQVIDALRHKHGWKLADQIGQGGFAQVYKELIEGVPRAVKIPFAPLDLADEQKQRELQALEVARRVAGHPRLVGLIHYELVGGYLVTVWEWADGGSLADLLQRYRQDGQQGIPLEDLLRYMLEAAEGIDYLNQKQGIYHRDIKPENLLLFHGHVKLADLGLAKIVGASTASHTRAGTWGYLPPEASAGQLHRSCDLYSLAGSYIRLRTGRLPFGEQIGEAIERQKRSEPVLEGITGAEQPLVLEALAADPDKRFADGAVAWVRAVEQALKEPSIRHRNESLLITGVESMDFVASVCFSPDGRLVLTGSWDKTARLWDAATGKELRRFVGHTHPVESVCFSPDGRQVLTGSTDKTARLWDAATGKELRRFEGHTGWVNSVCFSPDGRQVLTGARDGTARLWDAQSGREICTFYVLEDGGWLTFTPQAFVYDGRQSTRTVLLKCLWVVDNTTGQRRPFTEDDFQRFDRPDLVAKALARH